MSFCIHCGGTLTPGASFCGTCGRGLGATSPAPPPPGAMTAQPDPGRVSEGVAITALLLNIFVWPGLGSLIAGVKKGWAQGFLCLGGWILTFSLIFFFIGIPMLIGAYVWGIVTGARLLQGRPG